MVKTAKIIIGANYGDEGKGLATAHFSWMAQCAEEKCLNILFNGGPQRGHTVELEDGFRHIFHHFGAGSVYGADTYFDSPFMVDPMSFVSEYNGLCNESVVIKPKCLIHPKCRVITPYDAIINQIVELSRDINKHGSCGYGIWETQKRYEDGNFSLSYEDLTKLSFADFLKYLRNIRIDYLPKRLLFYNISRDKVPAQYKFIFDDRVCDGIDLHYFEDFKVMENICDCVAFEEVVDKYDYFVYEGAQGLALDADNVPMKPYVTASKTGAKFAVEQIKSYTDDIEIVYISRTYFTRHGAGPFPTECRKEDFKSIGVDATNKSNPWQDIIRYGTFELNELLERVSSDRLDYKTSLMLTHCNEVNPDVFSVQDHFDMVYLSYSPYPEKVLYQM